MARGALSNYAVEYANPGVPVLLYDASGSPIFASKRLAADNLALPTAPDVLATLLIYDGTTLDLLRDASSENTAGALKAAMMTREGSQISRAGAVADASDGNRSVPIVPFLYDGSARNMQRGNLEVAGLSAAARTTTISTSDITNFNHRGCIVRINVTANASATGVTVSINGKDLSGSYYAILTGVAITGTGLSEYIVYPGVTVAANAAASRPLPKVFRVTVTHGDGSSVTYSVDVDTLI